MLKEIHIGKEIQKILREQERSVSWFARKLHCNRSNIYKIFSKKALDTELLLRISKILNFNFFKLLCTEIQKEIENNASNKDIDMLP